MCVTPPLGALCGGNLISNYRLSDDLTLCIEDRATGQAKGLDEPGIVRFEPEGEACPGLLERSASEDGPANPVSRSEAGARPLRRSPLAGKPRAAANLSRGGYPAHESIARSDPTRIAAQSAARRSDDRGGSSGAAVLGDDGSPRQRRGQPWGRWPWAGRLGARQS